jgi:hypothetical protein
VKNNDSHVQPMYSSLLYISTILESYIAKAICLSCAGFGAMVSFKQPGLWPTSLFHILLAALLLSQACLLMQPAWARAINSDRRLLVATDKVSEIPRMFINLEISLGSVAH